MKKKSYDDDDGRTIVDMSSLEAQPIFLPRLPKSKKNAEQREEADDYQPDGQLSGRERRATVLAALGAAFLIAGVFAAAGAGLIAFLIWAWT